MPVEFSPEFFGRRTMFRFRGQDSKSSQLVVGESYSRKLRRSTDRAIFEATLVAARSFAYSSIHSVFSFEILTSTEQAPNGLGWSFAPSYFVDVTKFIDKKVKAMKCYKQEMRPYPFPRSTEGIKTLARFRGMASNTRFAEVRHRRIAEHWTWEHQRRFRLLRL